MKLTIRDLSNLCTYGWEVEKRIAFYMRQPAEFKQLINTLSCEQLREFLEHLEWLLKTVDVIAAAEVELQARGHESMWSPVCQVLTARKAGVSENVINENIPITETTN